MKVQDGPQKNCAYQLTDRLTEIGLTEIGLKASIMESNKTDQLKCILVILVILLLLLIYTILGTNRQC